MKMKAIHNAYAEILNGGITVSDMSKILNLQLP